MSLNSSTTLVTGCAGFIGSNFIRCLFRQSDFDDTVDNLDKLTYVGWPPKPLPTTWFPPISILTTFGTVHFVQENESFATYGVLRGLHFQKPPLSQGKLVRVINGEVLDVVVDIRLGSPWYGKHVARKLNGENKRQMWIPQGFAHGYIVLSKEAIFSYKCDNYYSPAHESGLRYDDPFLEIDWLLYKSQIKISEKDSQHPSFEKLLAAKYFEYKLK